MMWIGAGVLAAAVAGQEFVGMWAERRVFGPELRGAITVDRAASPAQAALGAFTAGAGDGGSRFAFPGGRGELRVPDWRGSEVRAYWLQPPGFVNQYAYATRLWLRRVAPKVWRGWLQPNDDDVSVTLIVRRDADDTLRAFIREPGYNVGLRYGEAAAKPDGRRLDLAFAKTTLAATLDDSGNALTLALPELAPVSLVLHRNSEPPQAAVGSEPLDLGDGWPVATPQRAGLDPHLLGALETKIAAQRAAVRAPDIHAVLIARHGVLVVDDYFDGYGPQRPHDLRSASKSFDAAIVGAAMAGAPTLTAESRVLPFFSYPALASAPARKHAITVSDLLSMRSGLACDDYDDGSPGNEDRIQSDAAQPDWYSATLDLPVAAEPGTVARYCSMGLNLLGGVVAGATRRWIPQLFDERLGRPLQFDTYHLEMTPTGQMYLGGGSYLRPRDFLKLGQLFLGGGTWHGTRLLPARWVAASLRASSSLQAQGDYAFGWHLASYVVGGRRIDTFEAGGNGGQIMIAAPALDLVVLIMAGNYGDYRTWNGFHDLLRDYVLAAAR